MCYTKKQFKRIENSLRRRTMFISLVYLNYPQNLCVYTCSKFRKIVFKNFTLYIAKSTHEHAPSSKRVALIHHGIGGDIKSAQTWSRHVKTEALKKIKVYSTFNICSFSEANKDTEPNTSLNNFRYKLEFSTFAKRKITLLNII